MVCSFEMKNGLMIVNCANCLFGSSLEDFDVCMAKTVDKILEMKKVERIILAEKREHEYNYDQTKLLIEIADVYNKLLNEDRIIELSRQGGEKCQKCIPKMSKEVQLLVGQMIRRDPIAAYIKVKRLIRHYQYLSKKAKPMCKKCSTHCYAPSYQEKIREVMKFSGLYLIRHGRLDLLAHYLF